MASVAPEDTIDPDELFLVVGGQTISGWQGVSVTLSMEQVPSVFDITFTERYPGAAAPVVFDEGDPCEVRIGRDTVIKGFIDRYVSRISAGDAQTRIIGRGKCADLVDCSAEWQGGQISGASAVEIATKLCAAYGIKVRQDGDPGPTIPQFNFTLGQTAFDIIETVCRYAGRIVHEDSNGDLVIGQIATAEAASGVVEGQNLLQGTASRSSDERFSDYNVYLMATQVLGDVGQDGNQLAVAKDPGVKRNRKRYIIAEAPSGGQDVSKQRAFWEASRRFGRSIVADVEVDSWRDSAGKLWAPNTVIPIHAPRLRIQNEKRVLSRVKFERDERGTRARLELMPAQAFKAQPILLLPVFADVA